jgi:hypothetical protein
MMKKFLILMLVLGLASAANAVIVGSYTLQVAPNAVGPYSAVVDSELYLMPSDYLWIGVHNSIPGVAGASQKDTFYLGIVQPVIGPANTTWTGNWIVFKPPLVAGAPVPVNERYGIDTAYDDRGNAIRADWWQLNLTDGIPNTNQGIGILDAKELHCEFGPSDDVIVLMNATSGVIEDTIVIHQIPEPATIALLGLGGLLLKRRR